MSDNGAPAVSDSDEMNLPVEPRVGKAGDYLPLNVDRKEFRLLRLRPYFELSYVNSSSVQCDLFIASRDDAPDYLALSYTWGDASDTVPIQVDGFTRQVTRNLHSALLHIREEDKDVVIWADALCIDQSNYEEKNVQVACMTEIYALAKCTIIWLGNPGDNSDLFIQSCNEIGGDLSKPKTVNGVIIPSLSDLLTELNKLQGEVVIDVERSSMLEEMVGSRIAGFIEKAQTNMPRTLSFLNAYRELLGRKYWGRVWILQEFVVSSQLMIQCGKSQTKEADFRAVMFYCSLIRFELAQTYPEKLRAVQQQSTPEDNLKISQWILAEYPEDNNEPGVAAFKRLIEEFNALGGFQNPKTTILGMRKRYHEFMVNRGHSDFTLIRLLASVFVDETAQATNDKDRIYAVLGMASDREELALQPNYDDRVTFIDVYTATARALIMTGNADLLSFSQHHFGHTRDKSSEYLPSWAPDWSNSIVRPSGQLPWDTAFAASGNTCFQCPSENSNVGTELALDGWIVDTIERICPPWIDPDENANKNEHNTKKYLTDISELCKESEEKFMRTGIDIYSQAIDRQSAHFLIPVADQRLSSRRGSRRADHGFEEAYAIVVDNSPIRAAINQGKLEEAGEIALKAAQYVEVMKYQKGRRPWLSTSGYVGLSSGSVEQGDVVVIFRGAKFPYLLRRAGGGNVYVLIGEAYVHGIMYGEFLAKARCLERFVLE